MHHVRVALDDQPLGDLHRAGGGDAPDVVAPEIDEHDVLGDLLGVVQQLLLELEVVALHGAARTRARDRPHGHLATFDLHEELRRRAEQLAPAEPQVEMIRRRRGGAKRPVEGESVAVGKLEPLGQHDLDDVARVHVFLRAAHHRLVLRLLEVRPQGGKGVRQLFLGKWFGRLFAPRKVV